VREIERKRERERERARERERKRREREREGEREAERGGGREGGRGSGRGTTDGARVRRMCSVVMVVVATVSTMKIMHWHLSCPDDDRSEPQLSTVGRDRRDSLRHCGRRWRTQ
jgi:hypothetical protein